LQSAEPGALTVLRSCERRHLHAVGACWPSAMPRTQERQLQGYWCDRGRGGAPASVFRQPVLHFVGSALSRIYLKMFTARAATSRIVTAEIVDSASISSLARRLSGIASVGLNAIAFVNAT
jgi:hypothetical protein